MKTKEKMSIEIVGTPKPNKVGFTFYSPFFNSVCTVVEVHDDNHWYFKQHGSDSVMRAQSSIDDPGLYWLHTYSGLPVRG